MIKVLMTILYILLFILCLSIMVVAHELGHFSAAKIFKVYTQEFSIGFGPALIHKKRKGGETYFSLRIIPFGGYVSMYGEDVELEDGVQVDKSRSLEGIAKWKRAIILVAGVTMNAILAILIFFVYNVSFSNTVCYFNAMSITENSIAYDAGLRDGDVIAFDSYLSENKNDYQGNLHLIDTESAITLQNDTLIDVYTYLNMDKFTNYKEENLVLNKYLAFYGVKIVDDKTTVDFSKEYGIDANFKSLDLTITTLSKSEDEKEIIKTPHIMSIGKNENGGLENIGYSLYLHVQKPLPFFKAIGQSFVDFGNSSTLIFKSLGSLFVPSNWKNMGGIVSIGFETTSVLQNFGISKFLYIWGVISVNFMVVNLLPFPGLDGWQLLVLAVEAIAHKKIPTKVKAIISIVGLVLLFAFMASLFFKDIFTYIF